MSGWLMDRERSTARRRLQKMLTSTFGRRQDLITQVAANHWILLSQDSKGNWSFLLWGDHPLNVNLGQMSEISAEGHALLVSRKHLRTRGLQVSETNAVRSQWKIAMHCTAA
jgi:hypothetical protein